MSEIKLKIYEWNISAQTTEPQITEKRQSSHSLLLATELKSHTKETESHI